MATFPNHNLSCIGSACFGGGNHRISSSASNEAGGSCCGNMKLMHEYHVGNSQNEMKPTEDLLASELIKLSVQERSKAFDDLHCVGEELKECPELVATSLSNFERILQERNDPTYQEALRQNKTYVEDPSFRLKFLRTNDHIVPKSVQKMLAFLRHKETYFGREKMARDITLDDLNEEDKQLLQSGIYHVLDGGDRNGRAVVFLLNHMFEKVKMQTMIRVNYFVFFNILSSMKSVQSKGVVIVYYDMSRPGKVFTLPSWDRVLQCLDFITKVPVRRSAIHHCLKTGTGSLRNNNTLIEGVLRAFPQFERVRFRLHYGSDLEFQYLLQSYGIPRDSLPVDSDGNIRTDIQNAWLHKYCQPNSSDVISKISSSPVEETIVEPSSNDILLGRGRAIQNHAGNISFREFLKEYEEDYERAQKFTKKKISTKLTHHILDSGFRFLRRSKGGGWVESDVKESEKKVAQLFRTLRKTKKSAPDGVESYAYQTPDVLCEMTP